MAINKTSQMANRFGLNTKLYDYATYSAEAQPLATIDFANVSEISINGDTTWATGGQSHGNIVAFNNPLTGSFKLSTQIVTSELLALMAGENIATATTTTTFKNTAINTMPKYFVIVSETVWVDKEGEVATETLTFHKAMVKRSYNTSYTGDGEPGSLDIEFELGQDDEGKVMTTTRVGQTTNTNPDQSDTGEGSGQ